MRLKVKNVPESGSIRTVTRFAFLPVTIGDQMVWLERYLVRQRYSSFGWYTPRNRLENQSAYRQLIRGERDDKL